MWKKCSKDVFSIRNISLEDIMKRKNSHLQKKELTSVTVLTEVKVNDTSSEEVMEGENNHLQKKNEPEIPVTRLTEVKINSVAIIVREKC